MRIQQNILMATAPQILAEPLAEPAVRPDQVARGKALIADPTYPSKEHIQKIARVLATNLTRDKSQFQEGILPQVNGPDAKSMVLAA